MTCVSLKSGSASSGTRCSDHQPAKAPARAMSTTAARWRADRSMILAIIGLHPAFRVEEERARDRDALAGREAFDDRDAVAMPAAGLNVTRLEDARAAFDEHVRVLARQHDGVGRYQQRGFVRHLEIDVHEHVGTQHEAGVIGLEPK